VVEALARGAAAEGEYLSATVHTVEYFEGYPTIAGRLKELDVVTGTQVIAFILSSDGLPFAGVGAAATEGGADLVGEIHIGGRAGEVPWLLGLPSFLFGVSAFAEVV
jgi:hypothetical protein